MPVVADAEKKLNKRSFVLIIAISFFLAFIPQLGRQKGEEEQGMRDQNYVY